MRLLLVDNLLFAGSVEAPRFDPQPHLGLMSLVAVARSAGFEAAILNPRQLLEDGELALNEGVYAALAEKISDAAPDVVGFTALGCNIHCVVQTAQAFRRLTPDCPILLGGPHATILHRELLSAFACFDLVARHEAEHSLPLVLQALQMGTGLADIPGITFRRGGAIVETMPGRIIEDLDVLPVPDYASASLDRMRLEEIRIDAGRGCPFSCTFCSTATFFGRRYRLKSPERLVAEMDSLSASYGFDRFKLNHDLFTVNRKMVAGFCAAVRGRGYQWSCSARMDCVDAALLETMAEAGCRDIYFGIETGSARMQEITKKRLDLGLIIPTLAETDRLSIRSTTSFITGYPEEEQADLDATLDALGNAHLFGTGLNESQLHLLTPEPGTELMNRHGAEMALDAHVSEFNFPRLSPDDDRLLRKHPRIFPNHHHYPTRISRARLIFTTDLWPILYELERPVLAHLLAAYEGRLSVMASAFFDWAQSTAPDPQQPSLYGLAACFADQFGAGAWATSLARFAAHKMSILRSGRVGTSTQGSVLQLSPAARLLPACHDVRLALTRGPDTPAPVEDRAPRSALLDWLLVRRDGAVRLYEVNSETLNLLSLFHEPRDYVELLQSNDVGDDPVPAPEDLAALIDLGALHRVSPGRAKDAA